MAQTETPFFERADEALKKLLYEDIRVAQVMENLEKSTGTKREILCYGLGMCVALYLVYGETAGVMCNTIGFVYPAYASIVAIETEGKDDDTQWLTYWVVFALFSICDCFSELIMQQLPLYWLGKCIFLLWLYLPFSFGAQKVYYDVIRPMHLGQTVAIPETAPVMGSTQEETLPKNPNPAPPSSTSTDPPPYPT